MPWLERMAKAICMAGARLTSGIYNNVPKPKAVLKDGGLCGHPFGMRVLDVEDPGEEEIRVCEYWKSKSSDERKIDLILALARLSTSDTPPTWIAEWVVARHAADGNMRSTGFTDWDLRPNCSRWPMLNTGGYNFSYVVNNQSELSYLRQAWDESWKWVESAWRRLFRMSLLYMEEVDAGNQSAADQKLREAWNFGGWRLNETDPSANASPYWGAVYPAPRIELCISDADACRDVSTKYTINASLLSWFGEYSRENFITVFWVVSALASRFQGNFFLTFMNDTMWRTKFHVLTSGKRAVSYPSGEIWFKNNFRDGSPGQQALSMCHEMMHYLVRGDAGGRPRDIYNPACTFEKDANKCYGDSDSLKLAMTDDDERMKNLDNYRGWIYWHYKRWCGDWPPVVDTNDGDVYHPDPISDDDWVLLGYDHLPVLPWTPLLEIRDQMLGSDWKPF